MAAKQNPPARPDRKEAEQAVRTLIRWAGENPDREGLRATPSRVVQAWREHYTGYEQDPASLLQRTFAEGVGNYLEPVVLTNIEFHSHCEHHLEPIIGAMAVGYLPDKRIVGLSKLVRVCEVFARRMQTQEALTLQIAEALQQHLKPRGTAVWICARHYCMINRGVRSPRTDTETSCFLGDYSDPAHKKSFLKSCRQSRERQGD